jgi:endonuclease III
MMAVMDRLERFYGPLPRPPADPFALYVWEVLGLHTTPMRRDAAMTALRRLPALTPDSMGRAPRAKLEGAIALAGPYRDARLRALAGGVEAFKRHRDLPERLRSDAATAHEALGMLPHLTSTSGQRMLLFAGGHAVLPDDPHLTRVVDRLLSRDSTILELGGVLTAIQRAALYLSHHGSVTCLESEPMCHICPLRNECPFPKGLTA